MGLTDSLSKQMQEHTFSRMVIPSTKMTRTKTRETIQDLMVHVSDALILVRDRGVVAVCILHSLGQNLDRLAW